MITIPDSEDKLILLAPMAGVTDKPFRRLCRRMGAHACVSEMITSDVKLYGTRKSRLRRDFSDEGAMTIVQIAGADPERMAEAALRNIDNGADIIDINMGCPAKKVCNVMAGSSLLKDQKLVEIILRSVVKVSSVPVTLKIRTGWDKNTKNAVEIAKIAEDCGISRLTVHGRTRACRFRGQAEHETVARVKASVSIDVIANGDIKSVEDVCNVLNKTNADGIMIGRASMGNPWLFSKIRHYFETGKQLNDPGISEMREIIETHLRDIYEHYGEYMGVRIARKHIYMYCGKLPGFDDFRKGVCIVESGESQLHMVNEFFSSQTQMSMAA